MAHGPLVRLLLFIDTPISLHLNRNVSETGLLIYVQHQTRGVC